MAIACAVGDTHLAFSTSATNFTTSREPFSISCWINANWGTATVSAGVGSFVGVYGPSIAAPTGGLQIGTRGAGLVSCWAYGGTVMVQTTAVVASNVWHHVAYTYDGTAHAVYVDGVLGGTSTVVPPLAQFSTVYINGYPTGGAGETSTALVDNYSYYDRTLSAEEVMTIFLARGARHGNVYGILAKYEFDDGPEGTPAAAVMDFSGNNNNLTAMGTGTATAPITHAYTGAIASSNIRRMH